MPERGVLRRRVLLAGAGTPLLLFGCAPGAEGAEPTGLAAFFARLFGRVPPPPPPEAHYVLGAGYPAGGVWYYPRESLSYDMTGIAEVMGGPHDRLTTDGELFDATAMTAAHQTLQLPVVVRVTNLSNGRQTLLRVNDRGPASPARVLGVTKRAAELLGFEPDGTARVRMQVETGPSQALIAQLNGAGSRLDVATAPVGAVQSAALPPPPGARGSAGRAVAEPAAAATPDAAAELVPLRLPETVVQTAPNPGSLWIDAGSFGRSEYARRRAAQLADAGAQAGSLRSAGETRYTVRIGPIESVAQADTLMQRVVRDGVIDARVVVE